MAELLIALLSGGGGGGGNKTHKSNMKQGGGKKKVQRGEESWGDTSLLIGKPLSAKELNAFVKKHGFDDRAVATLKDVHPILQRVIVEDERGWDGVNNKNAILMGRIGSAQIEKNWKKLGVKA